MVWQVFLEAIRLFLESRTDDVGAAVFDKDDTLAVEFVTAAANLRSIAYNIPTQSLFAAKVSHAEQLSLVYQLHRFRQHQGKGLLGLQPQALRTKA